MQTTWKHTFIGAVLGILLPVVNGFAASPPNGIAPLMIPAGGFAIEGNLLANTPTSGVGDWIAMTNSFPGVGRGVLAANGTPLNAATTFHYVDPYATYDTIMTGGSASGNPNTWTWGTDLVLNKEDMNNGLVHIGRDASNHVWVIVSADHTGTGDADMFFYFLQNTFTKNANNAFNTNGTFSSAGPHAGFTMGDLRLKLNFSGSSFLADRWQTNTSGGGYKWVDVTTSLPAGRVFMAVNPGNTYVPYGTFGSTNYPSENFIEAAVDFSVLVGGTDPCASIGFKNVFIATLHPSGTMSDFINPIPAIFTIGLAPDAGADQIKCYSDALTTFSLNGSVNLGGAAPLSTNWSVISGDAIINSPGSLNPTVQVPSTSGVASVTLRLTVTTDCTNKSDDIVLTVQQPPVASITGATTSCLRATNTHTAPVGMNSYLWTISGNGSISGPANQQTVKVVAGSVCDQGYTVSLTVSSGVCTVSGTANVLVTDTTQPALTVPPDRILDCPADTRTNATGVATATDGCSRVTVTYSDSVTNVCGATVVIARTWVAMDECGNTVSQVQMITVRDITAPVIAALPAPKTIACPATPSFAQATATDTCDQSVTLTFNDVTTPGSCPGNYSVKRTWTATDDCGNSSTASQTINVQDITAPVIAALPAPTTINCPATPNFAQATVTDACDQSVTLTFNDVTTPGSCPGNYSIKRTWTATDDCGNSSTASQTINVQDITAPVIAALPALTTINCPATPSFAQATVTDACDQSVTLTFNDVTTPGSCPGNYSIKRTWTATDDCGNSSTASQTINVQDITAPVIAALPTLTTINCPATPSFTQATATDTCDQSVTLTFNDVTTPGSCPGNYSVKRTWTATDDCGNSSTASQIINVQDITAPVIAALPAPTTINCPATPSFAQATATDTCDQSVTLTFQNVTTPGSCPGNYSVTRTWTATDDCGNSSTASQTINVQDITAPVIAALPAPTTINCPATPSFAQATATDTCDQSVTLTFNDVTTPGSCPGNYSVKRTWTATDDCGNSSTASQTINVQDITAPVIAALPAPTTINCPATPSFTQATATDTCDQSVTLTFNDVTTPGSCPGNYSVKRTWTATDDCGNSSTASQIINVQDITAPVIAALPAPTTINCPATPSFAQATATDTCDQSVTLTFQNVTTPGSCPGNYSVTRTWTATDDCGNSSTASQTINVQDITPPALKLPASVVQEAPGDTRTNVTGVATAPDACGSALVTYSEVVSNSCGLSKTIWRLWTAVDQCGNTTNGLQTIVVRDTKAPVVQTPSVTVQCAGDVPAPYATLAAFLAAGGKVTEVSSNGMSFSLQSDSGLVGICPGKVTRVYRVTDACGNIADASQQITVSDTIAPSLTCLSNKTVQCADSLNPTITGFATATDNCDTNVAITYSDAPLASSYSVMDFFASDPESGSGPYSPTYAKLSPASLSCPPNGRAQDPLRNAVCYASDGSIDALSTMSSQTLYLGQIMPFQVIVTMDGAPGPEKGRIEFSADWATHTTSNDRFGYDTNYMVYCAFVDPGDRGTIDPHTNARVESVSSILVNRGTIDEKIRGTIRVAGLDPGDRLVVEVWLVLSSTYSSKPNGTISASLVSGYKVLNPPVPINVSGSTISINANKVDPLPAPQTQPPLPPLPSQPPVAPGIVTSVIDRTWAATDDCGNRSTCVQRFTVMDLGAPSIIAPADVVLEAPAATGTNVTGVASALDCTPVVITYSDSVSNGCGISKTILRRWTATDDWGNSTNVVQTITVRDTTAPTLLCPANVALECPSATSTNHTGTAMASDAGGLVTISYSDVVTNGCGATKTIARTWTAVDVCGNSSSMLQVITVTDTTAPTLLCPANVTLEYPTAATTNQTGAATASDAGGAVTISFADVMTTGSGASKTIARTWTAVDSCGNSSSALQVITVTDTTAPTLLAPANVTLEYPAATSTNSTGTATASDAGPVMISYSDVVTNGCGETKTIIRTWTAADADGNSSSAVQLITVTDTTAPTVLAPANVTLEYPATTSTNDTGVATASDDGGAVTISFADTVTSGSGPAKTIARTWTAVDPCGNSSSALQVITVTDTIAPTLLCPANVSLEYPAATGTNDTGVATASDTGSAVTISYSDMVTNGCGATKSIARTWTAVDASGNSSSKIQLITVTDTTAPTVLAPANVTLEYPAATSTNHTGVATASDTGGAVTVGYADVETTDCGVSKTITRTWTATDACGNSASKIQIITVSDTTPPTLFCPANIALECPTATSTNHTGAATASDAGGAVTISYADVELTDCGASKTITRTWTATDACGNSSSKVQIITVSDTTPPTIFCPKNVTLEYPAETSTNHTGTAIASDAGGAVTVGYADVEVAVCGTSKYILRTWTAMDACGNSSSMVQEIYVSDTTAPTLLCPANVTVEYPAPTTTNHTGVATASEAGGPVTISFADEEVAVCGVSKYILRTWTAMDACGNSSSMVQEIYVSDTTAPTLLCPANVTVEYPAPTTTNHTGVATASEAGGPVTISFTDEEVAVCGVSKYILRTWTAMDACGNKSSKVQEIYVSDTTALTLLCPANVTVEYPAPTTTNHTGVATASEAGGPVTISFTDEEVAVCGVSKYILRTWTAMDACGNSSSMVQEIYVSDTTAPTLHCPANVTVEYPAPTTTNHTGVATASEAGGSVTVSFADAEVAVCGASKYIIRTWTAMDACGNKSSKVQEIYVSDTTPPAISSVINKSITPGATFVFDMPTASDNGSNVIVSVVSTATNLIGGGNYSVTRTWRAMDVCGNVSTKSQTITVEPGRLTISVVSAPSNQPNSLLPSRAILLAWPTNAVDYRLEYADNPGANRWYPVAITPILTNGEYRVYAPLIGPSRFFRIVNTAPYLESFMVPGNNLRLTWPTAPSGFELEASDTIAPGSWVPVATVPAVSNALNHITIPANAPKKFYRLKNSP